MSSPIARPPHLAPLSAVNAPPQPAPAHPAIKGRACVAHSLRRAIQHILSAAFAATLLVAAHPASASDQTRTDPAAAADSAGLLEADCRAADIRCRLAATYEQAPATRDLALAMWDRHRVLTGVLPAEGMDGGYRGFLELEPQPPVDEHRKHLAWMLQAADEVAELRQRIVRSTGREPHFRLEGLRLLFFRSVNGRSPSGLAYPGRVLGYNVVGSLQHSPQAARDLLVHELFHMASLELPGWTQQHLEPWVEEVTARCGTDRPCLAPFAPRNLTVRGGTFYAFQPNNGYMPEEYAAELAVRYVQEQVAAMRGIRYAPGWFKCSHPGNARAMAALRQAFFAGFDATPACR